MFCTGSELKIKDRNDLTTLPLAYPVIMELVLAESAPEPGLALAREGGGPRFPVSLRALAGVLAGVRVALVAAALAAATFQIGEIDTWPPLC